MSSQAEDIGKNVLGAVHAAGSIVLSAFGLGGVAQTLERVEASQGWLPDWAIQNATNRQAQQQAQQARDPGPGFLAGPFDIKIAVPHNLPPAEARRRLELLAAAEGPKYSLRVDWLNALQARLSRAGLTGELQIAPNLIAVGISVSGLLSLARGRIEARATELLQAAMSGAPLPADTGGAAPGPPNPAAWESLDRSADPAQVQRLVRALRDLGGTGITREQAQGIGAVPYLRAGVQVPGAEEMATEIDRYFKGLRVSFGARGVRPAPSTPPIRVPQPPPVAAQGGYAPTQAAASQAPTADAGAPPAAAPRRWLSDPVLSR